MSALLTYVLAMIAAVVISILGGVAHSLLLGEVPNGASAASRSFLVALYSVVLVAPVWAGLRALSSSLRSSRPLWLQLAIALLLYGLIVAAYVAFLNARLTAFGIGPGSDLYPDMLINLAIDTTVYFGSAALGWVGVFWLRRPPKPAGVEEVFA